MHGTCIRNMFFFTVVTDGGLDDSELESKLDEVGDKQKHQLKHRELFLSRQVETLPATHIRGKCTVTLLNETESLLSYLNKDVRIFPPWIFFKKLSDWIVSCALANISFTIEENVQMQYIWYVPYFTLFRTHFSTLWCTTLNRKLYLPTRVKFE